MTPTAVCEAIFGADADRVDPSKSAAHLSKFWHDFQEARQDHACLRVSTMNLVIVCSSPADLEGLRDDLDQISGSFPARVIVGVVDPEAKESAGWFTARSMPDRDHHLGWELIGLQVPDGEPLPSLVIPLLRDGLPVFLWWRGSPPFNQSWFETLVESSRRVMLDSRNFACEHRLGGFLLPIAALAFDKYHQEQAFSDLSWGRIRQWGQLVAGLFDRPENLLRISNIRELDIEYWEAEDDPVGPPAMALYMASWLCSRFGWKPDDSLKPVERGFATQCGKVHVRFTGVPTDDEGMAQRLLQVRFSGEGFQPFAVERDEADPDRIGLSGVFNRAQLLHHSAQLSRKATLTLMTTELETLGRDPVYLAALSTALQLCGLAIPKLEVKA